MGFSARISNYGSQRNTGIPKQQQIKKKYTYILQSNSICHRQTFHENRALNTWATRRFRVRLCFLYCAEKAAVTDTRLRNFKLKKSTNFIELSFVKNNVSISFRTFGWTKFLSLNGSGILILRESLLSYCKWRTGGLVRIYKYIFAFQLLGGFLFYFPSRHTSIRPI